MPAPDTVLQGRYRIVRQLGRGGMGAVYEAVDERLSRTVALKETLAESDDLKRAFEREARLLANLSHPALPKVIDHFTEDDGQFVVMEFIPGSDLGEQLEKRGQPFSPQEVARWADDLLDALDYLHTHEPPIIHRDIKPSNLKLSSKGRIILLDFGLAKGAAGQMTRTSSGMSVIGYTLHYAALEQIQGERTGPRSDLYSLSATLYQLLTGRTPVDALKRAADLLNDEADPLAPVGALNPAIPAPFAEVLMRSLSIKPSLRPESAAAMRAALKGMPAEFAYVAPVEEDEMTKVSVTPGRSGRLPPIAIGGEPTMVLEPPVRRPLAPNGAGSQLERTHPTVDARSKWRMWWLAGGGAVLAVAIIVTIILLARHASNTTVTPATAPTAYEEIPAPFREAIPSIAALTMQDGEGKLLRQASGFFFQSDEVATSLSVIEGAAQGRVSLVGQSGAYEVTGVTGVDREHGLVTLKVARAKASGLGIASKKQTMLGEKVAVIGAVASSGAKIEPAYAPGAISSYRDDDRMEIGVTATQTAMGGPLFNAEGEVIGIITETNGGRGLAVPVSFLADLIGRKQPMIKLGLAGSKDVLYDWRRHDPIEHPELAKELEQKIISDVAHAHEKAPQPAPQESPQAPAEGAPAQSGGWWQDEMSHATVTAVAEGSFTAPNSKQTAYLIDTHSGNAANNGGPKYLAIFAGETYVADFALTNLSLILQTYDLNRDGMNELLLGYYVKQGGEVKQWAKLVYLTQGQLRVIKDFGTTYLSTCEAAPERNPGALASAIYYAPAAAGQMPEMRVDNYQAACPSEGSAEQWIYTSAPKLPESTNK